MASEAADTVAFHSQTHFEMNRSLVVVADTAVAQV